MIPFICKMLKKYDDDFILILGLIFYCCTLNQTQYQNNVNITHYCYYNKNPACCKRFPELSNCGEYSLQSESTIRTYCESTPESQSICCILYPDLDSCNYYQIKEHPIFPLCKNDSEKSCRDKVELNCTCILKELCSKIDYKSLKENFINCENTKYVCCHHSDIKPSERYLNERPYINQDYSAPYIKKVDEKEKNYNPYLVETPPHFIYNIVLPFIISIPVPLSLPPALSQFTKDVIPPVVLPPSTILSTTTSLPAHYLPYVPPPYFTPTSYFSPFPSSQYLSYLPQLSYNSLSSQSSSEKYKQQYQPTNLYSYYNSEKPYEVSNSKENSYYDSEKPYEVSNSKENSYYDSEKPYEVSNSKENSYSDQALPTYSSSNYDISSYFPSSIDNPSLQENSYSPIPKTSPYLPTLDYNLFLSHFPYLVPNYYLSLNISLPNLSSFYSPGYSFYNNPSTKYDSSKENNYFSLNNLYSENPPNNPYIVLQNFYNQSNIFKSIQSPDSIERNNYRLRNPYSDHQYDKVLKKFIRLHPETEYNKINSISKPYKDSLSDLKHVTSNGFKPNYNIPLPITNKYELLYPESISQPPQIYSSLNNKLSISSKVPYLVSNSNGYLSTTSQPVYSVNQSPDSYSPSETYSPYENKLYLYSTPITPIQTLNDNNQLQNTITLSDNNNYVIPEENSNVYSLGLDNSFNTKNVINNYNNEYDSYSQQNIISPKYENNLDDKNIMNAEKTNNDISEKQYFPYGNTLPNVYLNEHNSYNTPSTSLLQHELVEKYPIIPFSSFEDNYIPLITNKYSPQDNYYSLLQSEISPLSKAKNSLNSISLPLISPSGFYPTERKISSEFSTILTDENSNSLHVSTTNSKEIVTEQPIMLSDFKNNKKCGIQNSSIQSDIIHNMGISKLGGQGGDKEEVVDLFWQVAILFQNSSYICSGVLIDSFVILTAAHCIYRYRSEIFLIRLSLIGVKTVSFYSSQIYIHQDFDSETFENDIALIKFQQSNQFYGNVNIICPPTLNVYSGKTCNVTFWDQTQTERLLAKEVSIISQGQCQTKMKENVLVSQNYEFSMKFLCAQSLLSTSSCQNNGGSPLVCEVDGKYELVGLVSWGVDCGYVFPEIYTNVMNYLSWINSTLQNITQ